MRFWGSVLQTLHQFRFELLWWMPPQPVSYTMTVLCSLSEGDVDEITEVQATPTISADHHTKRFSDFTNIIHVETHLVLELVLELDWGDIAEMSEIKIRSTDKSCVGLAVAYA